jgi:glycosyltransferase involved in cell wall biosynthesis
MQKILTIIIPTYNMEKYLHKCLDSLIVSDVNMKRLEVLIVNDGSKDVSSQIAHEYENKYPKTFRVIDKENGNYGSCINRGLKEAMGKYVKVLDADDYYDTAVFDKFIAFLEENDVDLVISDFNEVDENGNCLAEFTFNLPIGRNFKLKDVPNAMNTFFFHHGIAYKRELFIQFNYKQTEGISYTDDEWIFKPMMWVDNVAYFPHTLYLYLRGREGQTFDPKVVERDLEQRVQVAKEILSFYNNNIHLCKPENVTFITEKLKKRVLAVYYYHLIRFRSSSNNQRIKQFDLYLKQASPDVYERLNNVSNRLGWHYVRQWRLMDYSNYAPMLIVLRMRELFKKVIDGNKIQVDQIPNNLKRKI